MNHICHQRVSSSLCPLPVQHVHCPSAHVHTLSASSLLPPPAPYPHLSVILMVKSLKLLPFIKTHGSSSLFPWRQSSLNVLSSNDAESEEQRPDAAGRPSESVSSGSSELRLCSSPSSSSSCLHPPNTDTSTHRAVLTHVHNKLTSPSCRHVCRVKTQI